MQANFSLKKGKGVLKEMGIVSQLLHPDFRTLIYLQSQENLPLPHSRMEDRTHDLCFTSPSTLCTATPSLILVDPSSVPGMGWGATLHTVELLESPRPFSRMDSGQSCLLLYLSACILENIFVLQNLKLFQSITQSQRFQGRLFHMHWLSVHLVNIYSMTTVLFTKEEHVFSHRRTCLLFPPSDPSNSSEVTFSFLML